MGRRAAMLSRLAAPLAAVAVCLCLALLALAWLAPNAEGRSFGQSVSLIARTTWARALLPGRNYRIWVNSLLGATPILLTGLAVAVAFRAGVLNIGAQGQFIVAAIAATAIGVYWHAPAAVAIPALLLAS